MKTIKPMRLGVLARTFEHKNECFFTISVLGFFSFEAPKRLLPDTALWPFAAEELGKDAAFDMGMPKPRGEVLVFGKAYPPAPRPRSACSVRVALGAVDKTLYAVGDRVWKRGVASEPEPFSEMPLTWERAFGGEGYARNPRGKGYEKGYEKGHADKTALQPLPNIEDARRLVKAPGDCPEPETFGAIDFTWPQRASKMGTYDAKWLKELSPGLAEDADLGMFNAAPSDQQLEGFFSGDEAFVLENMHPDKARLESRLPGLTTRCFVTQKTAEGEVFRSVPTRLDTVMLFPHAERGIVIYRGLLRVREDDAEDILHLLLACEDPAAPKSEAHYKDVLAARLDKKKGAWLALRDRDLMPAKDPEEKALAADKISDVEDLIATEGLLQKNIRRRAELETEKARDKARELGLDPDVAVPKLPPEEKAPDLEELAEAVEGYEALAAQAKLDAEKAQAEAEQKARKDCADAGFDYEKIAKDARRDAGGPPKFRAEQELQRLLDMRTLAANAGVDLEHVNAQLENPDLMSKLVTAERELREAYRKFAHHFPEAAALEGDDAARVRTEVLRARDAGESFEGRDLTGADLSKLDLSGANFDGAFLERADLSGSNLVGASFVAAVLSRANLTGADLSTANLAGVNLGRATLHGTLMNGAAMKGATLYEADLSGASLRGANIEGADLFGAVFGAADLGELKAAGALFYQSDLSGVKLDGACLTKASFVQVTVTGVDFSGAELTSAVMVEAQGEGAGFRGASLANLRLVKECSFNGADFHGANLKGANLRGTKLAKSDFGEADLTGADLSGCDLSQAKLDKAVAKGAMMVRTNLTGASLVGTNLMEAILQKSKLFGSNLRGANLFRSDLAKVELDGATSFEGALLNRARVIQRRPREQG